jgi:hypothetical protein
MRVAERFPRAKFCEADGTSSKGAAENEGDVDTWLFRFITSPMKSASIAYENHVFGAPVDAHNPLLGDPIIPLPVKRGLQNAIDLKNKAGHKGKFQVVLLRWPLYPGDNEPLYIFRDPASAQFIFVGVNTGDVSVGT